MCTVTRFLEFLWHSLEDFIRFIGFDTSTVETQIFHVEDVLLHSRFKILKLTNINIVK